MLEDRMRRYARATIRPADSVRVFIIGLGNNSQGLKVLSPIEVKGIDISVGGIKLQTTYEMRKGIKVKLKIVINGHQIETEGTILRVEEAEEGRYYALQFAEMRDFMKLIINNFIKQKVVRDIRRLRQGGV